MNKVKSPALEILGMAMAAVTVLIAALMVLKQSFQNEAFASNSLQEATSVADLDQPATTAAPLGAFPERMDEWFFVCEQSGGGRLPDGLTLTEKAVS